MSVRGFGVLEIVVLLVALGGGAAVVATYVGAIKKAERMEAQYQTLQDAHKEVLADNSQLRLDKARLDGLLKERESTRQARAQERSELDAKLTKLFSENTEVREWGARRVPRDLADSLRGKPAGQVDQNGAKPAALGAAR